MRKSFRKCKEEYPWFVNVFLWLLMEAALVAVEIQV
jgi:Mn2+/Fe2+ NRAMP family transporter